MAQRSSEEGRQAETELLTYLQTTPKGKLVVQKHMRKTTTKATINDNNNDVHEDAWNEL